MTGNVGSPVAPGDTAAAGAPSPAQAVPVGAVGILGGTFDPIHVAHLAVAEEAREALGLERVLFIPAGVPPHKPGEPVTAAHHRLAMVELAIAGNPAFACSRLEVDRPGPSYTVDTVAQLVADAQAAGRTFHPTLILSAESFAALPSWRDPDRLLAMARVAVAPRGGYGFDGRAFVAERYPRFVDRVTFLSGPRLELSATVIRARVAAGRSVRYLVPDAVSAYIGDHGLYSVEDQPS